MWYSIQIESFPLVLLVRRDKYSTCDILCLLVYDMHPEYFSEISINICKCFNTYGLDMDNLLKLTKVFNSYYTFKMAIHVVQ